MSNKKRSQKPSQLVKKSDTDGPALENAELDKVVGGKPQKADGSLDAGIHFKYDIKSQKEG